MPADVSDVTVTAEPSALERATLPEVDAAEIDAAARLPTIPVAALRLTVPAVTTPVPEMSPAVAVRATVLPVAVTELAISMLVDAVSVTLPGAVIAGTERLPVWFTTISPDVEFAIEANDVTAVVTEMPVAVERASVPAVTVLEPPLIEPPVLSESEFVPAGEIGAEIVMLPAVAEPKTSVPAVKRSICAAVSPSDEPEYVPRLIVVPAVSGATVIVPEPAVIVGVVSTQITSALTRSAAPETAVDTSPPSNATPSDWLKLPLTPAVPDSDMAPVEETAAVEVIAMPSLLSDPELPPPMPVIESVPPLVIVPPDPPTTTPCCVPPESPPRPSMTMLPLFVVTVPSTLTPTKFPDTCEPLSASSVIVPLVVSRLPAAEIEMFRGAVIEMFPEPSPVVTAC